MSHSQSAQPDLRRVQLPALAAGVAGLAACAVGAYLDPGAFYQSYLFAYLFWFGIALGSLAILMLHHLVGGAWGFPIRRLLESAALTLPLLLVLFLPLLLGLGELYEWARPDALAADSLLQHKSAYLNPTFFVARAAIYFAIWIGLAFFLNRWSLEQDRTDEPALARRMRDLSRFGLVLYMLTMTFAAIDWVMSIEPHWYSTIYGLIYVAGQGLAGFSVAIIVAALLSRREPLAGAVTPERFGDLGGLLLAFVMFWAYVALSQFLLIWSANLPEEVTWYVRRIQGGWSWVIIFVIAFQFVLPFLLLLARRVKRTIPALAGLAGLIMLVHLIDLFWLVVPPFRQDGLSVHWLDLAAPIGIGGLWVAAFAWLLARRPLLPLHDPRAQGLQEATEHG
ncbi:MAG TPA: hypothetical protein VF897_15535 [Roseiflexaceae bacterium]